MIGASWRQTHASHLCQLKNQFGICLINHSHHLFFFFFKFMGWFAIIIGKVLNFWQGLHWNNQFFFTKHWEESRTVKEWYSKAAQRIADKARGECSDRRGEVRGELPLHVLISFYLSFWMPRKINANNVGKQAVQNCLLRPLHVSFCCF